MTAETLFIEWLEKQEFWLKSLFHKLSIKDDLTDDDYKEIVDNYIKLHFENIPICISNENLNKITLKRLYGVKGVNRLAQNQELKFGKNLTVVYGENGTGKTGYSRIIQHIGKCLGEIYPIRSNVFNESVAPEAQLDYFIDENPELKTLQWKNLDKPQKLNIKLFNSSCVKFSLNNERKIDFKPYIFHLCEKLAIATTELHLYINQRLNEFFGYAVDTLEDGTEARNKVLSVICSDKKDLPLIDEYVKNLDINELKTQKTNQETEKNKLNETALLSQKKLLENKSDVVNQILETITKSNAYLYSWNEEYVKNKNEIQLIKSKTTVDQIISSLNIDEKLKDAFVSLISATDKLYKLVAGDEATLTDMKKCPICRKDISSTDKIVVDLLKRYDELLSINKAQSCGDLIKKNQEIEGEYNRIFNKLKFFESSPQVKEDEKIFLCVEKISALLSNITNPSFTMDLEASIDELKKIILDIDAKQNKLKESITSIDEQTNKINNTINELNAKIYLKENWEQERVYILSYINLKRIKNINNHGISKCQKDIQERVYKESFLKTLKLVLKNLNAPEEIKFNTAIISSQMAIKQGYDKIAKTNQLNEILSEGEQTVVALAQFIAESMFSANDNVLFFDDPVNSLDLGRMQVIAKELVFLAKQKQIVIFTHNLVFLSF